MTASTSPFASHIARLLAHKRALGMAYHREQWFLAEFERATTKWPDCVLSEAVVRAWTTAAAKMGNLCEFEDLTEDLVQGLRTHGAMTISTREERVLRMAFGDVPRELLTTGAEAVREIRTEGHET